MISALRDASDNVERIRVLAEFDLPAELQSLARSLASAADVAAVLQGANWQLLNQLPSLTGERAVRVLAALRNDAGADQMHVDLAPALATAARAVTQILVEQRGTDADHEETGDGAGAKEERARREQEDQRRREQDEELKRREQEAADRERHLREQEEEFRCRQAEAQRARQRRAQARSTPSMWQAWRSSSRIWQRTEPPRRGQDIKDRLAMALSQQIRTVTVSPAMVQQRASDLLKSDAQILLLRTRPEWSHGDVKVGDELVRVLPGVSQLAVLDILSSLAVDEQAVILTDRTPEDLGYAVLARAYKQGIELPDEWQAVPRLFPGAIEVGRDLRRLDWAATALLDHQPPGGWPRSPEPALTARHAIGSLLAHVLGIGAGTQIDGVLLLTALGRRNVRGAWASSDARLR